MPGLLRVCTAGSVDDGKSTLIGRLLHDARGLYEDQVRSVETASRLRGVGAIDFSLFTDGLKAEREQGITIDVAYRYFSTARRKFILADTPGHAQYTRNMATGASTADLAILLVDATRGVRAQSLLHARIARLMGIREFVIAVNKMDLVGFDRTAFEEITGALGAALDDSRVHAVPVSALHGDNITSPSSRTPWYAGPGLLGYLESVETAPEARGEFRYAVQLVLRTGDGFRGYAGRIARGRIAPGDSIAVWPAGMRTRVARIVSREGDLAEASAPASVTLTLEHDVDVSRGDVLAVGTPSVSAHLDAEVVWMDERPLDPSRTYLLKHGARTVVAEFDRSLQLNEIGARRVIVSRPLVFDAYAESRQTGCFVVIDPDTCFTAGAGMIRGAAERGRAAPAAAGAAARIAGAARGAATDEEAIDAVRRALEEVLR